MPEGDSVFRLARRLRAALDGQELDRGELRVPAHATADLAGMTVREHVTHGKHLLTRLDSDLTLHTHLRMQGSWTVSTRRARLPQRVADTIRVRLSVLDGPLVYGLDLPVVDLVPTAREAEVIGHLGPDPLRPDWDAGEAVRRLGADPGRALVSALLDQRCIAGLGNLWVNEVAFLRGVHPRSPVGDVDLTALVSTAARCLRHSATHPAAYQVTTGNTRRGEKHWVAGRAGRPCLRCGSVVLVTAEVPGDAGRRRTWWCPSCQPGEPVP